MNDVVALLDDVTAKHFETGQPLVLRRGQSSTVVMTYDGAAFDIEFAGRDGRAFALLPVPTAKLIVLHESPVVAAA